MTKRTKAGYLRAFLHDLDRTYQAQISVANAVEELHFSLTLATVGLDDWLLSYGRSSPLQVAVIGPTQVGKSTVVNLLLGAEQAIVSPLAAYTDQLFGFSQTAKQSDHEWIHDILSESTLNLKPVKRNHHVDAIIWDTPDFDSHRSHEYRALIAKICALADVFVLVVSKEKYSDLSVWETLKLLRPLNRQLVVCLNKISSDAQVLEDSVRARLGESGWGTAHVPLTILPYIAHKNPFDHLVRSDQASMLRARVFDPNNQCDNNCRFEGLHGFIEDNWAGWLQPVKGEVAATKHWQVEVEQHIQEALADYQEQYLNHTVHYDAFNQVVLRLLELLEIPGLGRPLSKIRKALTWPVRAVLGNLTQNNERSRETSEAAILEDIVEHALLSLHTAISQHDTEQGQAAHWWSMLNRAYHSEFDAIRARFGSAVGHYQEGFFPEIEKAANSIYTRLQENPVVLNALRATRLGADVAAVILAIKTGTIGVSEALLTPAMLSVTSTLTEGAVGTYVATVRDQLKDQQYSLVQDLLRQEVAAPLSSIELDDDSLFLIDEQRLERIESTKNELFA